MAPPPCPLHIWTKLWTQHPFVHSTNDQREHSQHRPQTFRAYPRAVSCNLHESSVTSLLENQILPDFPNLGVGKQAVASPWAFFLLYSGKRNGTDLSTDYCLMRVFKFEARKNSTQKPSNLLHGATSPGIYGSEADHIQY